jgi:drug/metabolite transporter (DMT)-like permease
VRDPHAAGAAVIAGNLIACLICLPLALPVRESGLADWVTVSYLGAFQIGLAYVCLTRGVRDLPALETSLLLLSEPVLNAVWAWLLHGEAPGAWSLAGCGVILLATIALTLRRRG